MRWFKADPAGGSPALPGANGAGFKTGAQSVGIDDIRDRMLASIKAADAEGAGPVAHRIRYARDVEALWFLRGDLMALLAGCHGERAARARLAAISEMFEHLLPQGLRARPSLLNSQPKH